MAALARSLGELERGWGKDTQENSYNFATFQNQWDLNDAGNASGVPGGRRATPSYPWTNRASAAAAVQATNDVLASARKLKGDAAAFDTARGGVGSIFDNVSPPTGYTRDGAPLPKLGLKTRPTGEDPRRMDTYPREP